MSDTIRVDRREYRQLKRRSKELKRLRGMYSLLDKRIRQLITEGEQQARLAMRAVGTDPTESESA